MMPHVAYSISEQTESSTYIRYVRHCGALHALPEHL
jgi:hypothetical protein